LSRYNISLEKLDAALERKGNKELRKLYESLVHFPFIGLVKELPNSFGGGPTA
jgi:hypothetical protein